MVPLGIIPVPCTFVHLMVHPLATEQIPHAGTIPRNLPWSRPVLNRLPAAVLAQLERASQLTCVVEDACECRTGWGERAWIA